MKKFFLIQVIFFSVLAESFASGVCIVDAYQPVFFQLLSSQVSVVVNDQISTVVTTQEFLNSTGGPALVKYAFPLDEEASATNIRWKLGGTWYTAVISPTPQDTTLPGGGGGGIPYPGLMTFLGETPLYFNLLDTIPADSILTVELTYVQLLPYAFSTVTFEYPNRYDLIQMTVVASQVLDFTLYSQRTITDIQLLEPDGGVVNNYGDSATIHYESFETVAASDYFAEYSLNSDELGLFSFSTFFPDSMVTCDNFGNGFFTFIVEPDPNDSLSIIQKVFTLIVDRSGSMGGYTNNGSKMQQAIDAAVYIVENLNEGDSFNIVDFSTGVSTFEEDHVPVSTINQQNAISYIENFFANGLTNISGAFEEAIPDFAGNDTTIANIIIFLTDGVATTGITSTPGILQSIQDLINYNEINNLAIHTFGIGDDVNQQLLSQIASQNNGLCHFLENEELLEAITAFYNSIQNPVLLNPQMAIEPPIIGETYPDPLPNIYLGQQLVITGRYDAADSVTVIFTGEAFGQQQEYIYGVQLSDTIIPQNQFLTKLWAKGKMENLYVLYFTYPPGSPEAEEIREEIINISICYNVISPFTSYSGGGGGGGGGTYVEEDVYNEEESEEFCKAYPNPFRESTVITLKVDDNFKGPAFLKIYDNTGKLLHLMAIGINGNGNYEFRWDGRDSSGNTLKAGMYFYTITFGDVMYCGRVYRI